MAQAPLNHSKGRTTELIDPQSEQIGQVYAQAFLSAAEQDGPVEDRLAELDSFIADVLASSPEFEQFLRSAIIGREHKERVVAQVFKGRASPMFLSFLQVLGRHQRLDMLRPIRQACHRLYEHQLGKVRVQLQAAAPIPPALERRIRQRLQEVLAAEPIIESSVDADLLAGMMLRVGDRVYDGSLKKQLELLSEQIIERSLHEIQSRRDRFGHPEGD
jgi:F-type H+-transporting ATPase subunit delta